MAAQLKKHKTNTLKSSVSKRSSIQGASKKRPASRVGSTKLAKKSFFRTWMALPMIAAVAIAGYAVVQFSQASSLFYSFDKSASFMQGGSLVSWPAPVGKIRLLEFGQSASTTLTASQLRSSSKVCSWFYAGADNTAVTISVNGSYRGSTVVRGNQNGKPSSVCTQKLKLSATNQGGNAVITVAAGRAGVKLVRGIKLGGAGSAPPAGVPGFSANTGSSAANSANSAANSASSAVTAAANQAAAVQAVRRGQCEARPNYTKPVPIANGVRMERRGYRWNGRGCDDFRISYTVKCITNYRQDGMGCVRKLPNYGYAKAGSSKCLEGQPVHRSYKGASKYSCKYTYKGKTSYIYPYAISCNDPTHYKIAYLDSSWKACKKR